MTPSRCAVPIGQSGTKPVPQVGAAPSPHSPAGHRDHWAAHNPLCYQRLTTYAAGGKGGAEREREREGEREGGDRKREREGERERE